MGERGVLILAEADDPSALAVGRALNARACPSQRVGAAELALASWHHSPDGGTTRVVLPSGRCLDEGAIGVVLNRLDGVLPPQFARAATDDRDYAVAEFAALLSSWLHGLEVPLVNPPETGHAWAPSQHPLGWHVLAVAHGLETDDFIVASSLRGGTGTGLSRIGGSAFPRGCDLAGWYRAPRGDGDALRVWVFGEGCVGTEDAGLAARCTAFVLALGLRCAGLDFVSGSGGWRLVHVDACPSLEAAVLAVPCAGWLAGLVEGERG